MKASELRLGNLVYGINRRSGIAIPDGLPLKVLQIELFNTLVLPHNQNPATVEEWYKLCHEDISPIPLSEEWLLKFGFEKQKILGEVWCWRTDYFALSFHSSKERDLYLHGYGLDSEPVKHVHQLQNLYFSLTGTELKISQ